jgi:hypothetical protein
MIAHALADQVSADGKTFQVVFRQNVLAALDILVTLQRFIDLKVIAPTGEFEAVVAEAGRFLCHRVKRQVGPLPCKECYWPCHSASPFTKNETANSYR